ncbi:MAG TPA: carboxyl transferase domain-containing protein [Mycobacteriales bacterium]|nr:carboxyl transferase domain-containing protein [Mycobacteriales bacterium]
MPTARQILDLVLDPGSFTSWDQPVGDPPRAGPAYAETLAAARRRTGLDEAVCTGEGRIRGRQIAVLACEFAFLGGSVGVAAASRLVAAAERATAQGLPLVATPCSGGTRMQEGTVAFLQMVRISAAIAQHKQAGLPYLVYLRHPTTGGVFASWGSLGHVTAAEPGALVGFLGPRVYAALYGEEFPADVQTAENLYEHGLVDAVVPAEGLPDIAARALDVLTAARLPLPDVARPVAAELPDIPAWESIQRSRRPDRPGVRALLKLAGSRVSTLNGTGAGEADPGLLLALARFGAAPCVVLGQDRRGPAPLGPAGLRAARRGMRLAAELGLPLVSVIDTAGAALSKEAEEGGLAGEIARCLAELVELPAPTVCVLLGQGAGGGALALLPADRVVAAQHAWLSPLPPEGAAAILYRGTSRAAELATAQGVRSADLLANGIVDYVVPEHPDAAEERIAFLRRLGGVLAAELTALLRADPADRLAARAARFRRLGA